MRGRIKMVKKEAVGAIKFDLSILDGLYKKNTILVSGLVIAPVVVAASTVKIALALIFAFSMITFFTILISSFVPRDIVYAIRIILYTFIGALVYVPTAIFTNMLFPNEAITLGIFIPLLITNSLIVSKTELRFFRKAKSKMVIDVLSYILGFDLAVLIFAFFREIFSTGSIGDRIFGIPLTFSALSLPFGGFILLGLFSALFRKIQFYIRRNN